MASWAFALRGGFGGASTRTPTHNSGTNWTVFRTVALRESGADKKAPLGGSGKNWTALRTVALRDSGAEKKANLRLFLCSAPRTRTWT
jgi:hypothetical protein